MRACVGEKLREYKHAELVLVSCGKLSLGRLHKDDFHDLSAP